MQNSSETSRSAPAAADLIVRGKRVIMPEGERAAAIHVRAGVIAAVSAYGEIPSGSTVHEAGDFVVMPGVVDTHVHINEPGRDGLGRIFDGYARGRGGRRDYFD